MPPSSDFVMCVPQKLRERLLLDEDANTFVNAARSSTLLMGAQQPGQDGEAEESAEGQRSSSRASRENGKVTNTFPVPGHAFTKQMPMQRCLRLDACAACNHRHRHCRI